MTTKLPVVQCQRQVSAIKAVPAGSAVDASDEEQHAPDSLIHLIWIKIRNPLFIKVLQPVLESLVCS